MNGTTELSALEKLEKRVVKLETDRWEKWAQSSIVPIVLLLLGAWVNRTLQKGNEALEQIRVTSQQVDVAQKMLAGMFGGNATKDFATARLMRKVVDSLLSREVDSVLTAFYAERIRVSVQNGQLDTAAAIVTAAQAVGDSKSGNQLKAAVGSAGVSAVQRYLSKTDSARVFEQSAYQALARGDIGTAHSDFQRSESVSPGYGISYEMERLLSKAAHGTPDTARVTAVVREAVQRYGKFMPSDVAGRLRTRAGTIPAPVQP